MGRKGYSTHADPGSTKSTLTLCSNNPQSSACICNPFKVTHTPGHTANTHAWEIQGRGTNIGPVNLGTEQMKKNQNKDVARKYKRNHSRGHTNMSQYNGLATRSSMSLS